MDNEIKGRLNLIKVENLFLLIFIFIIILSYIANWFEKEYFIFTPYYKTQEPVYTAFSDSESVAGDLLFVSFDEMIKKQIYPVFESVPNGENNSISASNTSLQSYTLPYVDYFTPDGERVFEYYVT